MVFIEQLMVEFAGKKLFQNITAVINPKDRIGLVGKNGSGKSTLLNIIAGKMKPTSGHITVAKDKTIGYLPQELKIDSQKSIYNEVLTVFDKLSVIQHEIYELGERIENTRDYNSDNYSDLLNKLSEKHEELNLISSDNIEGLIKRTLKDLGFLESDFERPMSEFSGGWQMRVELAKLLISKPDLLLLDEPTNHLDIESIIWLEQFFNNYPGAIILVSHDRSFLDNITNRTIEIVFGKLYDYQASYTKYFQLRAERLEQQKAAYNNQQKEISQKKEVIERFRYKASKAKFAQSLIKQLDKMDKIEIDEFDKSSIKFSFLEAPRSGQVVIKAQITDKSYEAHQVLKDIDFLLERGEKVAFVGKNGEGKSTLVKLLAGKEQPCEGEIKQGHNVSMGYYAQVQQNTMDENLTVLKTIEQEAKGEMAETHNVRSLLGAFLFDSSSIQKKVKVLSGGEKSRLAISKLLLNPYNFLILDEPTNHLDMASKEILKQAVLKYNGAVIIVSHDRDFLQGLTTKTYEFKNKGIKEHLGAIDEFLEYYKLENFRQFESDIDHKKKDERSDRKLHHEQRKKDKSIQKEMNKLEKKINAIENEIAVLNQQLQDPEFYSGNKEVNQVIHQHSKLSNELDAKMKEWEDLGKKATNN